MRIRFALAVLTACALPAAATAEEPAKVSYYKDVRPIFQQHCNGCHQPAKPTGGFVMTSHPDLFKAGERGKPGVVAGKPEASYLVAQIKVLDSGKAEMPKNRDPLTGHEPDNAYRPLFKKILMTLAAPIGLGPALEAMAVAGSDEPTHGR